MRIKRRRVVLAYLAGLLIAIALSGEARGSTPSGSAAPLDAPAVFDLAEVQTCIRSIDEGNHATYLRSLYFGRHKPQVLPVAAGYALVSVAADNEPVGSKRWYLLKAVQGYGAFRVGSAYRSEGYAAYSQIFDSAGSAKVTGCRRIVSRAIYDFAFTMGSQYGPRAQPSPEEAKAVVIKALAAYLMYLRCGDKMDWVVNWRPAVSASFTNVTAERLIDQAVDDASFPRSLELYRTAASVYQSDNPTRAVELMGLEERYLPAKDQGAARDFYSNEVESLVEIGRMRDAIKAQRSLISLTGTGRGRLALLYLATNDTSAFNQSVSDLTSDGALADDVVQLGTGLLKAGIVCEMEKSRQARLGVSILRSFLSEKPPRSSKDDLVARYELGRYYCSRKDWEDARQILAVDHGTEPPVGTFENAYYNAVDRMYARVLINTANAAERGVTDK